MTPATTDVATGQDAVRLKAHRRQVVRHYRLVAVLMAPWLLGFLGFVLYPMLASLYFSFTRYNLLSPPQFVGFDNYRLMFGDPFFWLSIRNTLWMVMFAVPVQVMFAITMASLIVKPKRGIKIYRTLYYLPSMVPAVAASVAFLFLLNPSVGPINSILRHLGMSNPPLWFYNPRWSKPGLLLLGTWGIGDTMIIFMAAMLDIPEELYEAAELESANRWQKFRFVTLPMISPVIFFAVIIGLIYAFQYFTEAYVASEYITQGASLGAPLGSTLFYQTWLYEQAFQTFHMGYASAMAWMLFVISMICIIVLMKASKRWVHYEGGFLR